MLGKIYQAEPVGRRWSWSVLGWCWGFQPAPPDRSDTQRAAPDPMTAAGHIWGLKTPRKSIEHIACAMKYTQLTELTLLKSLCFNQMLWNNLLLLIPVHASCSPPLASGAAPPSAWFCRLGTAELRATETWSTKTCPSWRVHTAKERSQRWRTKPCNYRLTTSMMKHWPTMLTLVTHAHVSWPQSAKRCLF